MPPPATVWAAADHGALVDDGVTSAPSPESRALTGLRGVGAVLVMLHHFYLTLALHHFVPLLNGLLLKGYLGVDLFFVLSGFVMAMVYGSWFPGTADGRLRRSGVFFFRRAARLWPLHAVMVLVLTSVALHGGGLSPRTVAANLLMVQAWGISAEINTPAWSVSTECFAYLLFPLCAGTVLRGRGGAWLGLAMAAGLLAAATAWAPAIGDMRRGQLDIYYNYSVLPVLRCLAGFVLGMVAWRVQGSGAVRRVASLAATGPLALAAMFALMLLQSNDLLIYPLLPVIVVGFHHGRGGVWRAFAAGPLHQLGVLSYAVYLVHYGMLRWFPFGWASLRTELFAYMLATSAVAIVAHRAVELPGRRLVRAAGMAVVARLPRVA